MAVSQNAARVRAPKSQTLRTVEAIAAGLPCIFSDIEGFRMYRDVGLDSANLETPDALKAPRIIAIK